VVLTRLRRVRINLGEAKWNRIGVSRLFVTRLPFVRHRVTRQQPTAAKDGEHEDVVLSNAIDDAVATQQDLTDVVPTDLRDDMAGSGHACGPFRPLSEFFDPAARRTRAVARDVGGDGLEVSQRASGPADRFFLAACGHVWGCQLLGLDHGDSLLESLENLFAGMVSTSPLVLHPLLDCA